MKRAISGLLALMAMVSLGGCASTAAGAASTPSASSIAENPYGGFQVDPPADDEIVLTVIGTETRDYTMPELEALDQVRSKLYEPFVKQTQVFEGVSLAALFEEAGITGDQTVSTIALNDYVYDDLASNFTGSKAILALSRDGKIIPMDQGGPIRIVIPNNQDYSEYLNAWNWSLRTVKVIE